MDVHGRSWTLMDAHRRSWTLGIIAEGLDIQRTLIDVSEVRQWVPFLLTSISNVMRFNFKILSSLNRFRNCPSLDFVSLYFTQKNTLIPHLQHRLFISHVFHDFCYLYTHIFTHGCANDLACSHTYY